jgi:hypothetical protein
MRSLNQTMKFGEAKLLRIFAEGKNAKGNNHDEQNDNNKQDSDCPPPPHEIQLNKSLFLPLTACIIISLAITACGDGGGTSVVDPNHTHEWGEWQVTASSTCSAEGAEKRICYLDASHTETREIAINPNAHDWQQLSGTAATCTTAGSGSRKCKICGKEETGTLAALGHSWGNWAANTAAGTETRTCNRDSSHKETRDLTIAAFKTWLDAQSANTEATAYNVKLNVGDLGGGSTTAGSLGNALYTNRSPAKYVNLDLSGSAITSIERRAFGDCYLTSVTIPNSVTSIGDAAFGNCYSLTSVTIPNNVTTIGQQAFYGCTRITSVTIPAGVTSIRGAAFYGCTSLTSVIFATGSNIPNANFGDWAFPEGSNGDGGNTLKTAYSTGRAGTYTRAANGSTWMKSS